VSNKTTSGTSGVSQLNTVVINGPRATGFSSAVVGVGAFRDQKPVDVPLTNSVITRDVMDAQGAKSVMDAVRNTAGVTRSQIGSAYYDNIAVRGVTMNTTTSFRLNGTLPLISTIGIPVENKERVEVLKGASSMYYGMVPPAGIVSFETKRAGPTPVTSFATTFNQYGGYDVAMDVGRRFGDDDKFGLRVNVLDGNDDPGLRPYKGHRTLQSAAFDFRMLDNLTVRADFEHYTKVAPEQAYTVLFNNATVIPNPPDNRTNLGGEWAKTVGKVKNAIFRVDLGLSDNWNLTTEYGTAHAYRDRQSTNFAFLADARDTPSAPYNYTAGNGRVYGNFNSGAYFINNNARVDLSGRIETGPIAHETTFGWTRNTREQDTRGTSVQSFGCPSLSTAPGNACNLNTAGNGILLQNAYSPNDIPYRVQTAPNGPTKTSVVDMGIYAVDRIIFSPRFHLLVGLRRTDYSSIQTDPYVASSEVKTTKTTPNFSGIFKITPDMSVYASRLKGLEAGATVSNTFSNANALLPSAITTQTELGWKMQLATGALLQLAYFDIKKAQPTNAEAPLGSPRPTGAVAPNQCAPEVPLGTLQGTPPQPCTQHWQVQSLGGEVRYRGLEMVASGEATRNIGIIASAIFMNPKVTKDGGVDVVPTASNPNPPPQNLQGKVPGNTAKRTASLFGEYRFDAVPGLAVNAAAYYVGRRPVANTNLAWLPGVTTYSLGTRYRTKFRDVAATFQINIDNLADKNYWAAADTSTAQPIISPGLPRTIRGTAKFDF
jgi:iron complex outermembrane receptor protein